MSDATVASSSLAVRRLRALGDETRWRVVNLLLDGERCVCELMEQIDAAQSRLSFHLRVLKEAGLLCDRRVGRWIYYRLVPEAFADIAGDLRSFRSAPRYSDPTRNCD